MSKPVSMIETAEAIQDAIATIMTAMPAQPDEESWSVNQWRLRILPVILREYLDNEYVNDLEG